MELLKNVIRENDMEVIEEDDIPRDSILRLRGGLLPMDWFENKRQWSAANGEARRLRWIGTHARIAMRENKRMLLSRVEASKVRAQKRSFTIEVGRAALARWKRKKPDGTYDRGEGPPPIDLDNNDMTKVISKRWRRAGKPEKDKSYIATDRQLTNAKLMWTYMTYNMSPAVPINGSTYYYGFSQGQGPGLYWGYDYTSSDTSTYLQLLNANGSTFGSPNYLAQTGNFVYLFAADWPFLNMCPTTDFQQSSTQNTAANFLSWIYFQDYAGDPNSNVALTDFVGTSTYNKDWMVIMHYATEYTMCFTNYSVQDYEVEVLFFKMLADPHAMNYDKMCFAVQSDNFYMEDYCRGEAWLHGSEQVEVIQRDRFHINGVNKMQNNVMTSFSTSASTTGISDYGSILTNRNVVRKKYRVKNPYKIYKALSEVSTDYSGLTEVTFFNQFYTLEKGVYCRMIGWPTQPYITYVQPPVQINSANNKYATTCTPSNVFDQMATPQAASNTNFLRPHVGCTISKRSFIKPDCQILKGPFRTD